MIDPASFVQNGKYPQVNAGAARGHTFFGGVDGPPLTSNTGPSYRGGVVYGSVSLSEPNTSPDVITAAVRLPQHYFPNGTSELFVRSGTPICVAPPKDSAKAHDRRAEPVHTGVLGPIPRHGNHAASRDYIDDMLDMGDPFITVLVGSATFKKREPSYVALAVQNVATVAIATPTDTDRPGVVFGDSRNSARPVIGVPVYLGFHRDTHVLNVYCDKQDLYAKAPMRQLIPVTPLDNGLRTIRCDVGRMAHADMHIRV